MPFKLVDCSTDEVLLDNVLFLSNVYRQKPHLFSEAGYYCHGNRLQDAEEWK